MRRADQLLLSPSKAGRGSDAAETVGEETVAKLSKGGVLLPIAPLSTAPLCCCVLVDDVVKREKTFC